MHIVEVRPYDHFADSRSRQVEDALVAQIIDRSLVDMFWANSWNEEVTALLPWLWFADVDYQANAPRVACMIESASWRTVTGTRIPQSQLDL